ncbi:MAG: hypothetical protein ACE5HJ_06730 [Thermoplasmata archaeon]
MSGFDATVPLTFVTVLVLTFSLFLVITGAFTAYFGSGKSRKIGGGLLGGGFAFGIVWAYLGGIASPKVIPVDSLLTVIIQSIAVIAAAAIGAMLAIGLFLLAIMKS